MKTRALIAALFALWLAIGPAALALASSAMTSCETMETMSSSVPPDDCCGSGMDANACLTACVSAAPLIAAPAVQTPPVVAAQAVIPGLSPRYTTVSAPPEVAPPKTFVS